MGTFANPDDERAGSCHFRSIREKNMNISFSFDPKNLKCSNCPGRGPHGMGVGTGGGGGGRQTIVLSDQNFSPSLPCAMGDCLKILRVENGTLAELVHGLLDVTGGGSSLPAGSVVLIFSASHLLMAGLAGYVADLATEIEKIERIFKGGVVALPGIPIFVGGNDDSLLTRSLLEFEDWLKVTGQQFTSKTWNLLSSGIIEEKAGGVYTVQKARYRLPDSLRRTSFTKTWVSTGWTSPCEVWPATVEIESELVNSLCSELNSIFGLNLGTEPICSRLNHADQENPTRFLLIGGSHTIREANSLSDRGYSVVTCSHRGFRPNLTACKEMAAKVEEALKSCNQSDVIIVHCYDNVAYMARTEEGGDLPIIQYTNGEWHVMGDLVLASKERMLMYFKHSLHFLKLLENRKVLMMAPLPRYLYAGCCAQPDHVSNSEEPDFERRIREGLSEMRGYLKDFLFTNGLRGFKVLDPGRETPEQDENGEPLWVDDSVHPTFEAYNRIADLIENEARLMAGKRAGQPLTSRGKRMRLDRPRPSWVDERSGQDRGGRGGGRGGGGGGPRGGRYGGRPGGGTWRGGRGGRGVFYNSWH
jgi:hypothetical protein